jgi:hypothetical protein
LCRIAPSASAGALDARGGRRESGAVPHPRDIRVAAPACLAVAAFAGCGGDGTGGGQPAAERVAVDAGRGWRLVAEVTGARRCLTLEVGRSRAGACETGVPRRSDLAVSVYEGARRGPFVVGETSDRVRRVRVRLVDGRALEVPARSVDHPRLRGVRFFALAEPPAVPAVATGLGRDGRAVASERVPAPRRR